MKHFDITEWADFVLDTLASDERAAMGRHLAAGCPECASICELLQGVREVTAADGLYSPPEDLVSAAVSIAAMRAPERPRLLQRLVARLVYDSLAGLQPQGARGAQPASRQLALQAGDYHLDLQMESNASQVTLIGQFASHAGGAVERTDGVPVLLLGGGKVVARAVTNEFGEFCLEYRRRAKLRLFIPLESKGTQIEVALSQLESRHGE